ncbi:hypothetical protein ACOME3_006321 [Neoechinorhynchus agilis]
MGAEISIRKGNLSAEQQCAASTVSVFGSEDPQNTSKFLAMLGHLLELIPESRVDPTVGIKQKWRRRSSFGITSGDHFRIFYEEKNQYDFVEVSINGKGKYSETLLATKYLVFRAKTFLILQKR